jgi:hypothetical protein
VSEQPALEPVGKYSDAVALSNDGTTALVGSDQGGPATVFQWTGTRWKTQAILESDGENRQFGTTVSLDGSGTLAAVADPGEPVSTHGDNGEIQGAVYIFEKTRATGWFQSAKLFTEDKFTSSFGITVAVDGDGSTILIGDPGYRDPFLDAGATYLFVRRNGDWVQENMWTGNSEGAGYARVALSDDGTVGLIGSPGNEVAIIESLGNQEVTNTILRGEDTDNNRTNFGISTALAASGETAVIGAQFSDHPNGSQSGAAYVFERARDGWSRTGLNPPDGGPRDWFGRSLAISDNGKTVVVGSKFDDHSGVEFAGSAYLFRQSGGGWNFRTKLIASDPGESDSFGQSIALSADGAIILVGAWRERKAYVIRDF